MSGRAVYITIWSVAAAIFAGGLTMSMREEHGNESACRLMGGHIVMTDNRWHPTECLPR